MSYPTTGSSYTPLAAVPEGRSESNAGDPGNQNYRAIPIPNRSIRQRSSAFMSPMSPIQGSLASFTQSYQRALSFRSLEPRLKASRSYFQDDEELLDPETMAPSQLGKKVSTIFHPSYDSTFDEAAIDDASFLDQSYADYNDSRQESDVSLMTDRQSLARIITAGTESLAIRRVESRAGVKVTMVLPRSTVPQTTFNCVNVLIGVGLLALSKAMTKAGWVCGGILLVYSAIITYWTAGLLSKCMDTDKTLCTYADLGYKAYGDKARLFISILFSVELVGVGIALIVLFSDTFHALVPEISPLQFKYLAFFVLTPLSFLSLSVLSHISLAGITGTVSLVVIITILGLTKPTAPGSLVDPVPTFLWPDNLLQLCVSYGIILGPFGSHSLFPALKADLATPQDFPKCLKRTYAIGFLADTSMAVLGYAMFGSHILNEITESVLTTPYPKSALVLVSIMVSMIPIAKTPINCIPITNFIEYFRGITPQQVSKPTFAQRTERFAIKVAVNGLFVGCAIVYPEFDKIIGLSGASLCTLICIVLPCGFYVRICDPPNKALYYAVMFITFILGAISTYAAIVI